MVGLWRRWQSWLRDRLRARFRTEYVDEDAPERPLARTLYVVTEDGAPWSAAMLCPCGCGETLHMNLLPDERPVWRLAVDGAGFGTLHPSVHRMKGCRAHFWFRAGMCIGVAIRSHRCGRISDYAGQPEGRIGRAIQTEEANEMAKNTGNGFRRGAVTGRTQFERPDDLWQKRDERTGRFMEVKDDGKPFKGVAREPDGRDTDDA